MNKQNQEKPKRYHRRNIISKQTKQTINLMLVIISFALISMAFGKENWKIILAVLLLFITLLITEFWEEKNG